MPEILAVLGLALLPAFGNFAGGIIAEFVRVSSRSLNWALHIAAGIILSVVAVEIMPETLKNAPAWIVGAGFGVGGLVYVLVDHFVERAQRKSVAGEDARASATMWMVYVAVTVDLFSDGLMIGAGSVVSYGFALVLAVGQVLADIPEGFATIANFKAKNIPRAVRIALSVLFSAPVLIAASLSYAFLRGQDEAVKMATLAFSAGMLTVAVVEDIIREAHESAEDTRWSAVAFIAGFVAFIFVSAGLGASTP